MSYYIGVVCGETPWYSQRMKEYGDFYKKTLASEKLAKRLLVECRGFNPYAIKHLTAKNGCSTADLEYKGLCYDVKYSNAHPQRNSMMWDFCLRGKGADNCDFLILLGLDQNVLKRAFLIPDGEVLNRHRIRVPVYGDSKWYKYTMYSAPPSLVMSI
jgi:hypothetical protein